MAVNHRKATRDGYWSTKRIRNENDARTAKYRQALCSVYLFRPHQKTSGSLHAAETIQQVHNDSFARAVTRH